MGRKCLLLSDMTMRGSGYLTIVSSLAEGMQSLGYDVKVIGLGYNREEHNWNFGLIPCDTMMDAKNMIDNLTRVWPFDVLIVGLDIPHQIFLLEKLGPNKPYKFISITPMENGPLCPEWAFGLYPADFVFFISELGKQEAIKAGLQKVDHLQVGINTLKWSPMSIPEKVEARKLLGFSDEDLLILTVAYNQERKNLWAGMKTIQTIKENSDLKVKYLLVTNENSGVGWNLRSLAQSCNISNELLIYERGMSADQLRMMYNVCDVYLNTSKAEGLALPILEAMACGTLVCATNTGAITELLSDGRGLLIEPEYEFIDVWGNSKRSMASPTDAHNKIVTALMNPEDAEKMVEAARDYTVLRTQIKTVRQVVDKIEELCRNK